QPAGHRRKRSELRHDLFDVSGDERNSAVRRSAFDLEEPRDRIATERIGRESIKRVGWNGDDQPRSNRRRGRSDSLRVVPRPPHYVSPSFINRLTASASRPITTTS